MNIHTEDSGKLPWVKFSFDDWSNDLPLSRCSFQAQGIWMRMLAIMHHGEPYGHLATNGIAIDAKELAQRLGRGDKRGTQMVTKCLQELHKHGVVSFTKCGVIYSRRMVRDESIRLINRANGLKGGNPKIKNSVNPPVNTPVNPPVNPDVDVRENSLQHKPLSRNTAVKHQTARGRNDTALLAQESTQPETTAGSDGPPEPIIDFWAWVRNRVPNWAKAKAHKTWAGAEDQKALQEIFAARALFEIQACWELFITPGSKSYDHAVGRKFAMREFQRQIEYLITDDNYAPLKRRYMQQGSEGALKPLPQTGLDTPFLEPQRA